MALNSEIDDPLHYVRKQESFLGGIVLSAQHRVNTCVFESINNRTKVIKRMVYGYRDTVY